MSFSKKNPSSNYPNEPQHQQQYYQGGRNAPRPSIGGSGGALPLYASNFATNAAPSQRPASSSSSTSSMASPPIFMPPPSSAFALLISPQPQHEPQTNAWILSQHLPDPTLHEPLLSLYNLSRSVARRVSEMEWQPSEMPSRTSSMYSMDSVMGSPDADYDTAASGISPLPLPTALLLPPAATSAEMSASLGFQIAAAAQAAAKSRDSQQHHLQQQQVYLSAAPPPTTTAASSTHYPSGSPQSSLVSEASSRCSSGPPSPAGSSTKGSPTKRRRVRPSVATRNTVKACEFCIKRKSKCDGGQPCQKCTSKGVECVYREHARKPRNPAVAAVRKAATKHGVQVPKDADFNVDDVVQAAEMLIDSQAVSPESLANVGRSSVFVGVVTDLIKKIDHDVAAKQASSANEGRGGSKLQQARTSSSTTASESAFGNSSMEQVTFMQPSSHVPTRADNDSPSNLSLDAETVDMIFSLLTHSPQSKPRKLGS